MKNEEKVERPKIIINQAFIEKRNLSKSSLVKFRQSPKHYVEYIESPRVEKDAYIIGNLVECLLNDLALKTKTYEKTFQVFTKATGTGSVAKNQESYELATKNKLTLITAEVLQNAKYAVESIMSVDMSKQLVDNIKKNQIHLKWRDKKTNLPIHGFVDYESNVWGEKFAWDLKTTGTSAGTSADPDEIARQVLKWEYHIQTGCYLTGYHKMKFQFPYFMFLFVEVKPPYNVSTMFCESKFVEQAKLEFDGTLTAFRYCLDNNLFHQGYEFRLAEAMNYFALRMPTWYKPKYEGY